MTFQLPNVYTTQCLLDLWWQAHREELTKEETIAELAKVIRRHSPEFPHEDPTATLASIKMIETLALAIEVGEETWRLWGALLVRWPFGYPPDVKLTPIHELSMKPPAIFLDVFTRKLDAIDRGSIAREDLFGAHVKALPVPDWSTSKRGQNNG